MTQDFAKPLRSQAGTGSGPPGWALLGIGFGLGVFVSFLVYLWVLIPVDKEAMGIERPTPSVTENQKRAEIEEMQWDFYEIFPKNEVPIVEEFVTENEKRRIDGPVAYLLQTGSFRKKVDADRLRAELILMGLNVFIREIEHEGTNWHRVLVGPLPTELDLNRAQDVLARAEIESMALQVKP